MRGKGVVSLSCFLDKLAQLVRFEVILVLEVLRLGFQGLDLIVLRGEIICQGLVRVQKLFCRLKTGLIDLMGNYISFDN